MRRYLRDVGETADGDMHRVYMYTSCAFDSARLISELVGSTTGSWSEIFRERKRVKSSIFDRGQICVPREVTIFSSVLGALHLRRDNCSRVQDHVSRTADMERDMRNTSTFDLVETSLLSTSLRVCRCF